MPRSDQSGTRSRLHAAVGSLHRDLSAYALAHGGQFTLFGSAKRGEMDEASDVDVLVDFPRERSPEAESYAEHRAYELGLKPDIHRKSWASSKLLRQVEADQEGAPMSDDRAWALVLDATASASRHFNLAADLFARGGFGAGDLEGYKAEMAFLHAMQSGHTSAESALRRVLRLSGDPIPTGKNWHEQLINLCARPAEDRRPAVLGPDLAASAHETRLFRHWAMHGYDAEFAMARAEPAVRAAAELARSLGPALERFRAEFKPA